MAMISKDISKAVQLLTAEELVAIPTETVYGLAGNIYSEKAIQSIFIIKQRPFFNPLIVHIPTIEHLENIVDYIPKKAKQLAEAFWPGPITLVLKKKNTIPDIITAGKDTVAVRIPNHPVTLELLKQLPFPLAAPSANPFGSISPTAANHVKDYFKDSLKMVLDGGNCKSGIESTIIGFEGETPVVFRLGSTPIEAIEAVVGSVEIRNKIEINPEAPGMLERHYAPKTKIILTSNMSESINNNAHLKLGVIAFNSEIKNPDVNSEIILSQSGDMFEAAANIYSALHNLDKQNLDIIIAEKLPNYGLGKTINDRLERATK